MIHWANGGPTEIDNLIMVCHRHHRSVHEGGWNVVNKNGQFVFYDPMGNETTIPRLSNPVPGTPLPQPEPLRRWPNDHEPLAGTDERGDLRFIVDVLATNSRMRRERAEAVV